LFASDHLSYYGLDMLVAFTGKVESIRAGHDIVLVARQSWLQDHKILKESISNRLSNKFNIHLILAKQDKLTSNNLTNQLDKNRNLTKLTFPCGNICVSIRICFAKIKWKKRWESEKRNKE
jgi:GTP-binding protein EngB required for normal cell division